MAMNDRIADMLTRIRNANSIERPLVDMKATKLKANIASIWGMNHELTVQALDTFQQRYLDGFLRAVGTQVEPKHD